jgi:hypothetical protein
LQRPIIGFAPRGALLVASLAAVAGCASQEQLAAQAEAEQAAREQYEASLPRCSTDKECAAKWAAARRWVLDNCGFKLQHVSDDYLETYNIRDPASTGMWCRVTKTPTSETEYLIELENGANNWFVGGMLGKRMEFNQYVNAAWR